MKELDGATRSTLLGTHLVLVPGWATDWRIFGQLCAGPRMVHPDGFPRAGWEAELARITRHCPPRSLVVLGWSLGGFCAVNFARAHRRRLKRLLLVGVRRCYPASQIESTRKSLLADRRACLRRFYKECFLPGQRGAFRRFREGLMKRYLAEARTEELLEGLDYLARQRISPETLPVCPLTFVHGAEDVVAPPREASQLAEQTDRAELRLIDGAGHAAFMTHEFRSILSRCLSR